MGKSFAQVDAIERRLMHSMRKAALTWEKIKEVTGRSFDTLQNVFAQKCPPPRASPMKIIAPKGVKKDREHLKFTKARHVEVKGERDVSIAMIKSKAGVTARDKTCLEAFHANGIWYRNLKERPILTEKDVKQRYDVTRKAARVGVGLPSRTPSLTTSTTSSTRTKADACMLLAGVCKVLTRSKALAQRVSL